ncbi:MAG: hypothetical protein U1C33_01400, partial [Candidatus Cloacimonadaceae bacterium]|nr:hypothetical protein [Candidatus Cloacimonadaceae bacterium]
MKHACLALGFCLLLVFCFGDEQGPPEEITSPLKVLTINVWSGTDYQGSSSFGMWETPEIREQRYQELVSQLKTIAPDILFLQEVNPIDGYNSRLAKDLGMDEVHQVCIAGLKLLDLGIPKGFKEGNAILATRILGLEKMNDWKLSGGPGIYSDKLTLHADETVSALWARIIWQGRLVYLVNVHL